MKLFLLCFLILFVILYIVAMLSVITSGKVFGTLNNKKVVLNQSLLSPKDVLDFEYESRTKIYYNLPPLDERERGSNALVAFLIKLGFTRLQK